MSDSAITLRTRKYSTNRLLFRKQMIVDIIHPGKAPLSRKEVQERLAKMYNAQDPRTVVAFGFKTRFGAHTTTGFALIYDNIDAVTKFEPAYRLVRQGLKKNVQQSRKQLKERKNRAKKFRGVERAKILRPSSDKK
ncbi:40S small subunit ribosomal protein eS24 (rpS24) [Andalucia godoyi]|uniref:40S small subunit ribosomal protein eS24 (RpS24) n=1 Tax=Andalucia godoyi TaxID=505711 RepID=A0A8K0AIS4_ANDGO|nr:40S small subunit ribosomal protein eS24 (rpS24) [Andalucia godoyi]|eukprot:ANDGO_04027.mRNA.1 40S small subunit ribosomal protein eS24 (rpS24)